MDKIIRKYLAAGQMTVSNLLLNNYRQLGLDEAEFILMLQLMSRTQQGNAIDLTELSQSMQLDTSKLGNLLRNLIEKKFLRLTTATDVAGRKYDKYDFTLLYEKLFALEQNEVTAELTQNKTTSKQEVYKNIEVEFGRLLTPMELQTIDSWLNTENYSPELIVLALREAVLNQVYSLKYIDKILLSWEKQNIKTSADVQRLCQQRRQEMAKKAQPTAPKQNKAKPSIPMYDWSGGIDDAK